MKEFYLEDILQHLKYSTPKMETERRRCRRTRIADGGASDLAKIVLNENQDAALEQVTDVKFFCCYVITLR